METQGKKAADVQGTEAATEVKNTKKPSATYTLTQFNEMIEKLVILEMISKEDAITMNEIRIRAKNIYIERL